MILAPNHASFMDHFFVGGFIRRHVQFMAKSQMFGNHPLSWVYNHGGVFPVRRGFHDEEAFITAFAILDRGGAIGMYVEGGRSRTGEVGNDAKAGIGRLAIESGAPVVPVAILGLPPGSQLDSGCGSRRSLSGTAGRSVSSATSSRLASSSSGSPTRSWAGSARCTANWCGRALATRRGWRGSEQRTIARRSIARLPSTQRIRTGDRTAAAI